MTYFDWFMAIVGIICDLTIIFGIACKVKPSILKNEKAKSAYDFIVGYETNAEDLYETE